MDGWKEPYKSDRKLGSPRLFWMTCVFSRIASLLLVLELVSGQLSALMLNLKAVDSKMGACFELVDDEEFYKQFIFPDTGEV